MTLSETIKKLRNKEVSSTELTEFYLGETEKKNKELNCYLHVDAEGAKAAARGLDETTADAGERRLYGVPYATKDNILVKDMPCTAGSQILKNYTAPYDATVTAKLRGEGLVVLGKTNLDEFAMGSSTENSGYAPTKNPLDTSRVPGGSSGGSAAAVAAGLAPFALGSDTGGSIRQPAAFCGIVGFKPTYGAVSRYGLIAMASSLDQIGILSQTVEDAKIVAQQIIEKDEMDSTSTEIQSSDFMAQPAEPLKNLKIGIIKEYFSEGLDERIKKEVLGAIEVYKKAGAKIQEVSLPHLSYGLASYYIIMPSEVSSNLARYDGIKYGKISENTKTGLLDDYLAVRGEGFGEEVKRRIMLGTYTLSAGYYDAYYLQAQKVRSLIEEDFKRAFEEVDVVVSPTAPTLPFKFGDKSDPLEMYLSDIYTVAVNLAGLPAISMPVGDAIEQEGASFPASLQIIGPVGKDFKLLDIAELYEKETAN